MTPIDILIMAAGKGTRMKSRIPKVLQRLAGRPLLHHVLDQAARLQARSAIVITGHGATEVEAATARATSATSTLDLKFVRQEPQLGTGHGRNETSYARYVQFERESDVPNEVVAIRYDSHANLVALGVIPQPRPVPRHEPDPFPAAFVPDPPARW